MDPEAFLQFAGALPEPMLLLAGDGAILAANRAAEQDLGAALAGRSLFELVQEPAGKVRHFLRLWSRSRELVPGSLAWRSRAGIAVHRCEAALLPAGQPPLILLRCRPHEVSNGRFLAEAALASIGDGVVVTDAQGRLTFLNSVAEQLTGWTQEEAAERPLETWLRILDEQTRQPVESPVTRALRDGLSQSTHTILVSHGGAERPIDSRGAPIRDERGNVTGAVVVIRDMTERKRTEEHLRQAQKLESLGLLAGGIAHDFNNLLTGVLGNASLAIETVPEANPAFRLLEHVMSAAQRAAELTRQMLAYAGRGRFVIQPVDLSELVRAIGSLLRTSMAKMVDLRLELAENLPPVEADASQLQQVVMNLVINGAEAIDAARGGRVSVRTVTAPTPDGDFVCLEVQDNGSGMDAATQARMFDPFFTTKFTGRGLGLAATAGIVRGHGGFIRVRSAPGEGSTFQVFFPVAAAAQVAETGIAPEQRALFTGTVLVVDDEDVVRRTATAALKRCGLSVLVADNGRDAVELFHRAGPRIRLVLLDLTMPVLSGEETLALLQQIRPDVKVVLSSGYNELEATERFDGKGLAGFLQKPYTAAALIRLVRQVLGGESRPADAAA